MLTRPLPPSLLFLTFSCIGALPAADDFTRGWYDGTTANQTHQRESTRAIPSVYGDVRRQLVDDSPAYPLPPWTPEFVVVGRGMTDIHKVTDVQVHRVTDPTGVALDPYTRVMGEYTTRSRLEGEFMWRQSLDYGCWLESSVTGSQVDEKSAFVLGDAQAESRIGDPRFLLGINLANWRYSAISLAAGGTAPLGDKKEWTLSHGSFTYELGLRGVTAWKMLAVHADVLVGWCPAGRNEAPLDKTVSGGDITWRTDYRHAKANVWATWRFARWIRAGGLGQFSYGAWKGRDDATSAFEPQTMTRMPISAVIEVTPVAGLQIAGRCGIDAEAGEAQATSEKIAWAASIGYIF